MAPLHVALLANLKNNATRLPGMPDDYWADLDSEHWEHSRSTWRSRRSFPRSLIIDNRR